MTDEVKELEELLYIPVDQIEPNPDQPRTEFNQAELESLAASIKEHGLQVPISVKRNPFTTADEYYLIDGERRLRAHKLAGLPTIKAVVRIGGPVEKKENLVAAVIANSQRTDLNPVDEARSFQRLIRSAGFSQKKVAELIGKSITYVTMRLKLLDFEPEIQELFAKKKLPQDPSIIWGIADLSREIRVKTALLFVNNKLTVAGMKRSLTVIKRNYVPGCVPNLTKSKTAPSLQMASRYEEKKVEKPATIFSLLAVTGSLPKWELVTQAANETCKNCSLFDMASDDFCKECTAVDLIRRMTKKAQS